MNYANTYPTVGELLNVLGNYDEIELMYDDSVVSKLSSNEPARYLFKDFVVSRCYPFCSSGERIVIEMSLLANPVVKGDAV